MAQAVIVEATRTAFGRRGGKLKDIHPVDLGSIVVQELLRRTGIDPSDVDQVIFGCANQVDDQASNIARNVWLSAGLPPTTPGTSVDVRCGSSQQGIHFAANLIAVGACDVTIAGGVESMTRVPMGSAIHAGSPWPASFQELYQLVPQGISAELMARKYEISRREMDEYAVRSHRLALDATNSKRLGSQIVAVEVPSNGSTATFDRDEGIRPNANYDAVAALPAAFDPTHSITAGNSSQISDGSAGLLLMSAEAAGARGLRPRARIVAQSVVGTDPVLMLDGPIAATTAVLKQAGLQLEDIDLFEISEAFASVVLAWRKATGADMEKVNVNGGAISIGHPLGASGARLMTHLLYELERRDLRYGLQAMCCGGGIGTATIIDRSLS